MGNAVESGMQMGMYSNLFLAKLWSVLRNTVEIRMQMRMVVAVLCVVHIFPQSRCQNIWNYISTLFACQHFRLRLSSWIFPPSLFVIIMVGGQLTNVRFSLSFWKCKKRRRRYYLPKLLWSVVSLAIFCILTPQI